MATVRATERLRRALSLGWGDLGDALLDRTCPGCSSSAPRGRAVCESCDAAVPRSGTALCLRCLNGEPATTTAGRGCTRHGPGRLLLAGPSFEPPLDRIVHSFKYEGASALAAWVAALLPEPPGLRDRLANEFVLVPVSLHPARRAWRGFDQALLLARERSDRWGVPIVDALARVRDHEPQARLTGERRRINVRGAFRVTRPALVRGRPVLLVDDVATTGSTLLAAADELEAAGAEWILSLCASHGGDPGASKPCESLTLPPAGPLC